jgi:putative endopeptidase
MNGRAPGGKGRSPLLRARLLDVAVLAAAAASAAGVAGGAAASGTAGDGGAPPAHHAQIGAFGLDTSGGDPSAKPGDDFERYANGHWDDTAQIPPDRASWGSFALLRERSLQQLREILEGLPAQAPAGSNRQKLGDFYRAYLDSDAIEKAGLAPARPVLDEIAAARSGEDIARLMGRPELRLTAPAELGMQPDDKDPDHYMVTIRQSGLGMPDRDYYLKDEPVYTELRAKYAAHIERLLKLAGDADAAEEARAILALETQIATAHWPRAKRRERDLTYNPHTREDLPVFAPGFPWPALLAGAGLEQQPSFVLREADALQKLGALFAQVPVPRWQAYLRYHYLAGNADVLPKAFDDEVFDFYARALHGRQEQQPRWKRAVAAVDEGLGEAAGELYVQRYFPPASKQQMLALVENLRATYRQRIESLPWMSPATRKVALEKLAAFHPKIGYPDEWRDYSALEVKAGDAFGNLVRAAAFDWQRQLKRLGGPTDRGEWGMTPQTINAYYNPTFNDVGVLLSSSWHPAGEEKRPWQRTMNASRGRFWPCSPGVQHDPPVASIDECAARIHAPVPASAGTARAAAVLGASMSAPKAYRYARFSSSKQSDGMSLERQQDAAEAWAAQNGVTLDDAFIDSGVSASRGKNLVKGALSRFLRAVQAGDVVPGSTLLVESVSRFSRLGPDDMRPILRALVEAGVRVVFFDPNTTVTADNWDAPEVALLLTLLSYMAKRKADELSGYGRATWQKKRDEMREGKTARRLLPYWLRCEVVNGKRGPIEMHPTYTPIVVRIFAEYLQGRGKALIAKGLNADGIATPLRNVGSKTRAGKWRAMAVGRTLANPAVTGLFQSHKEVKTRITLKSGIAGALGRKREAIGEPLPAYYPRIISPEMFAQAAARRDDNRARAGSRIGGHSREVTHILARLACCPVCGASMTRTAKTSGAPPRYLCSAAGSGKTGACVRHYVTVADVERALVGAADTLGVSAPGGDPDTAAQILALEAQLTRERAKLAALTDSMVTMMENSEPISSVVNAQHTKLEGRVSEMAAALATLQGRATAAQPNVIRQRVGNMVGALKAYADTGPLGLTAPAVNAMLFECFARVVIDYRAGALVMHWRHGPPPATVKY